MPQSLDYWVKVLGMLQQNWAVVLLGDRGQATVSFVDDNGRVFDELSFPTLADAERGLRRNEFRRFVDDPTLAEFLRPPELPFRREARWITKVYSSGEYWRF